MTADTPEYFLPRSEESIVFKTKGYLSYQGGNDTFTSHITSKNPLKLNYKYRTHFRGPYVKTHQVTPNPTDPRRLDITATIPRMKSAPSDVSGKIPFICYAFVVNYYWASPDLSEAEVISKGKSILTKKNLIQTPDTKKSLIHLSKPFVQHSQTEFTWESEYDDQFKFNYQLICPKILVLIVKRTGETTSWGQNLLVDWKISTPRGHLYQSGQVEVGSLQVSNHFATMPFQLQDSLKSNDSIDQTRSFQIISGINPSNQVYHGNISPKRGIAIIPYETPLSNLPTIEWRYTKNIPTDPLQTLSVQLRQANQPLTCNFSGLDRRPTATNENSITHPTTPNQVDLTKFSLRCQWENSEGMPPIQDSLHSYTHLGHNQIRLNFNQKYWDQGSLKGKTIRIDIFPYGVNRSTAIVGLTRGYTELSGYNDLIKRNWAIYQHLNKFQKSQYPLLIFHEGNLSYQDQIYLNKYQHNYEVSFIDISPNCFHPPQAKEETFQDHWYIGYKHMCLFHSAQIWNYLRRFKFAIRLDEDCRLQSNIGNIMEYFQTNNLVHLSTPMEETHPETLDTLPGFADDFCKKYRIVAKNKPLINNQSAFSNFYVTQVGFWLSKGPQLFLREVIRDEGVYTHRWGDLPIHNVLLNIFADKDRVCLKYPKIKYYHGSWGTTHPS